VTDSRWIKGRVAGRKQWTENLFSLYVEADPIKFEAGQFVKLALPDTGGAGAQGDDGLVGRPYSFVNAPGDRPHEFYCVTVPQGPLSPRLASLVAGDAIWIARQPAGFLVLSEVPDAHSLWLICTGTGIGPFLSILSTQAPWRRYPRIVLVQGTRRLAERTHRSFIEALAAEHPGQFQSISLLSRDPVRQGDGMLAGRIPQAIADGRLEAVAATVLQPDSAQVMLCGNPGMIEGVIEVLKARAMRKHRRRAPGHITVENYW
jgi:ferredoxin--NADP+ reductase